MSREIYDRFTDGDKPERPLSPLLPTDDYESKQASRAEDLAAYEQYAAEEARGYEQIFWEQVYLQAFGMHAERPECDVTSAAKFAAQTADLACAERAKRIN